MTRRWLLRFVLVLYPSWWRDHYGEEAAAILAQTPPNVRAALDLLRGALDAWTRQRPPRQPFARFGDEALRVVVLAQKEAHTLHHNYVGTEHILLGILAVQDGVAAHALGSFGVSSEVVRTRLLRVLEQGFASPPAACSRRAACPDLPKWSMRLTPRAKKGLDLSCRVADRLGDPDIDAAHLLLGMLDEGDGIGARILAEFVAPETIREQIARLRGEG
jgi:ATP-dependent Clp protease ATP-binding subunit ClpC